MSSPRETPLVLVVDDDPMLRMLAVEALEAADFAVVEAADGAEGIATFKAESPDLVLLDLMMPEMDGYAVCRELRAYGGGATVPIMVMTGLDDAFSIDTAYEAGATDFVTKPINYGLLAHRIRYLLRSASAFRSAQASSRRLGRAQQLAKLAQWEVDLATGRLRWSEEAHAILGVPAEGDGASALLDLVHPDDRARVASALAEATPHRIEYRVVLADGRERVLEQHAEVVVDNDTGARLLSGAAQDVTELRAAERKARDLAYFDTLTGLPNRALLGAFLEHSLSEARRDGRPLAVLSLDLDGFKRVNDSLGHAAGDALLREVASRIASCIRSTDTLSRNDQASCSVERQLTSDVLASRLGGDEFVVVLSAVGQRENAARVARRITDRLAQPFLVGDTEIFVSSSIGIACFPDAGADADALLARADAAMYHAKQGGRGQFQFFTADIQNQLRQRLTVESALRGALARAGIHPRRDGDLPCELRLEYQPKVDMPSGQVVGVEALLRWTSPELGPVSPLDFIGIAEETGLISPLGEWVLRTACAQARAWELDGVRGPLRVAVNVSPRQFRDPIFAPIVRSVLDETSLSPELLELEITEGMIMQDTVGSTKTLNDLKRLGVRIALDDFGTGYSSLSYLTRLPIDAIKIDRSFIKNLETEGKSATITAAIIGLSRGLDIDVVIEGVETQKQLDFISQHGEAEIQGFFFAKPMTPQNLTAWRDDRRARVTPPRTPRERGAPLTA